MAQFCSSFDRFHLYSLFTDRRMLFQAECLRANRIRNLFMFLKLIAFGCAVPSFGFAYQRGSLILLVVGILLLFVYIALMVYDARLASKVDKWSALRHCAQMELDALDRRFAQFDAGERYVDPTHPFSFDLDLFGADSLFQMLNRCTTPSGADRLAFDLKNPLLDAEAIVQRQQAVDELSGRMEWCHDFRSESMLNPVAATDADLIHRWQQQPLFFSCRGVRWVLAIPTFLFVLSVIAGFWWTMGWAIAQLLFLIQLGITLFYVRRIGSFQAQLGRMIKAFGSYAAPLEVVERARFSTQLLSSLHQLLFGSANALVAFRRLRRIMGVLDGRANVLATILLNGLYMRDLHLMYRLDAWKRLYVSEVSGWIDRFSELEMLVSLASFRQLHPDFTFPVVSEATLFDAKAMIHPLLDESIAVSNDFDVARFGRICIVTGANMSGKSTFLRAVGVNLVLAQVGSVVAAREFRFSPVKLYTSMRTTDNLAKGSSYFHAELLRLKELVDRAKEGESLFVILDEMLKGTNSLDKLQGSRRLLERMLHFSIAGVVATHDLELGKLSDSYPDRFQNICFEIRHDGDSIVYDYMLRTGVCQTLNASILLQQMGIVE